MNMRKTLSPLALALLLNAGWLPARAETGERDVPTVTANAFRIKGSRAFSETELLKVIEHSVGRQLTRNELIELADSITGFYRRHGFPRARAIIPPQNFADGIIRFLITTAPALTAPDSLLAPQPVVKASKFRIVGSRAFTEAELLKLVDDAAGKELTSADLDALAQRITDHYRRHGFQKAHAVIPPQNFADGIVRFLVTTAPSRAAAPSLLAPPTVLTANSFRITGSRAFTEAELLTLVDDAKGRELTSADLDALAQRITDHYRKHGYGRARAMVRPSSPSEMLKGIVRFLITTLPVGELPRPEQPARPDLSEAPDATPQPPADLSGDPIRTLLGHAKWWEANNRIDLSQESLDKLFNVAPDHPSGLAMQARLDIRRNKPEQARAALEVLKGLQPDHPDIPRIEALLRSIGEGKVELRKARSLVKADRYDEALTIFRKLFPDGPPSDDLMLEYWQIVANTPRGWRPARDGIATLVKNNPDNLRYRLALAEHETSRLPLKREALQIIIDMTRLPAYSQQARDAWRRAMRRLGDSPSSLALLHQYLAAEPTDSAIREKYTQIVQAQAQHRRLMADPNYRAGIEGLALLDKGELGKAEPLLEQALRARPRDSELVGGMGMLRLRQGRHLDAQMHFVQAAKLTPGGSQKWSSLVKVARFWQLMREAREARKAGALELAENKVNTALKLDPREPNAIAALADIQADRGQLGDAASTYRRALAIEPLNGSALEGLLALYRRQGMTQAQHFVSGLSPAQRNELRESIGRLDVAMLEEQSDDTDALLAAMERVPAERRTAGVSIIWGQQLEKLAAEHTRAGNRDEAVRLLQEAETIAADDDEESHLAIATAWGRLKEYAQADRIFDRLRTAHTPPSSRWHLRHAQYLAMQESPKLAAELDAIAALPSLSPEEKTELYELQESFAVRTTDAQLAANDPASAHRTLAPFLRTSPDSVPLLLAEARAYRAEEQWPSAQTAYARVLRLRPDESEALRGMVETQLAAGDRAGALAQLDKWAAAGISSNPYNNMKQIDLYLELDEPDRAHEILDALMAQYPNEPNVLNRAWDVAQYEGRLDDEIVYLQKSLAAEEAQRVAALPAAQARTEPRPYQQYGFDELGSPKKIQRDWKERKLAALIDRRSPWFSSAIDMRTSSGTPGLSESTFIEMPLEYKTAWHEDDEVFFRADVVKLDVGSVAPTRDNFGKMFLCQPNCSPALLAQSAQGVGFTAGYQRDDLRADIGVTPTNFPVSNIVGGITRRGDLGDFGYSVEASRRPINTSLLAYAGTRDPATGEIWGGVVETGARLGLSHFKPENLFVFWSTLDLHKLTGRNVIANSRLQVMAGGQWRFINEENRLFSVGLSGRYTHHARNAGEYTFGHGGYYSPQNARSVSLSGTYGERFPRFSYVLRGSASASQSQTQSAPYFPTDPLLQQQAAAIGPTYAGGSGTVGFGYSAEAAWEYQLDQKLFVGGVLSVERAEYYSPNRALFYLRYSLEHPAAQPVYFTPEPVEPSSEF